MSDAALSNTDSKRHHDVARNDLYPLADEHGSQLIVEAEKRGVLVV